MKNSFIKISENVFYAKDSLPLVDSETIPFLKGAASNSSLKRARLCLHNANSDIQHDMLIAIHRDSYVAPHRHLVQSETFTLLEGNADLLIFDENGTVNSVVNMRPFDQNKNSIFFYRMPKNIFHSLSINSEFLIFIESTMGPFDIGNREHAVWAPDHLDHHLGRKYINNIVGK